MADVASAPPNPAPHEGNSKLPGSFDDGEASGIQLEGEGQEPNPEEDGPPGDADGTAKSESVGDPDEKSSNINRVGDDANADANADAGPGPLNVNEQGELLDSKGAVVGKLTEGDHQRLVDKPLNLADEEGNLKTEGGSIVGKGDIQSDVLKAETPDTSVLKGKTVNKAGNVVDEQGVLIGSVETGELKNLVGKSVDAQGQIWKDGNVIGTVRALPDEERVSSSEAPFEDLPDATVDTNGKVISEGKVVGRVIEGDPKKLAYKKVDKDGEIMDRVGTVLGNAERWEEEEPEPEEVDFSILAGKRVNKLGRIVDPSGSIYGKLVEGDPKTLAGRMCDKNGNVLSEGGEVVGKAELIPESEREGQKEGPFSGFEGLTVDKDGKVVDTKGVVVGRIIEGDAKKLYGRSVDEDGDILDKNGNAVGKAERWEEEEKEKDVSLLAGCKVNREGNVISSAGEIIGKLTDGSIANCAGMEIDDDGDIVNSKGQTIGHAASLENIPPEPEEPEETEEEKEQRRQLEQDKKLASQMANAIQQSMDKVQPILRMITNTIDEAEQKPKEELDEQKLVDTVRPLIEEGGKVLQEANGVIRGLDPDGRITANAKQKSASREATGEEYHLAELLKELSGNVSETIENAKKKIAGMPHAKKELNPLWGLLAEPLGQILAAVGLLLSGVLGLVGKLLSGLGLGGLLDNLLGGLGIKGVLNNLGLGQITDSLTGKK